MPKVYTVQENPRLNYVDAERFGDVVFMTNMNYSPLKNSMMNEQIIREIKSQMTGFDPDKDFLLLTGSPVVLGYVFHLAMAKKGYIMALQWDNMKQGYIPITFKP